MIDHIKQIKYGVLSIYAEYGVNDIIDLYMEGYNMDQRYEIFVERYCIEIEVVERNRKLVITIILTI